MKLPSRDFESRASTNSAIPARVAAGRQLYRNRPARQPITIPDPPKNAGEAAGITKKRGKTGDTGKTQRTPAYLPTATLISKFYHLLQNLHYYYSRYQLSRTRLQNRSGKLFHL